MDKHAILPQHRRGRRERRRGRRHLAILLTLPALLLIPALAAPPQDPPMPDPCVLAPSLPFCR